MKNRITQSIKVLIAISAVIMMLASCKYQEIRDAAYPEQLIYMPASRNGVFLVNTVALPVGSVPTPGNAYRYKIDMTARKFIIPLGVYRSGIDNAGGFTVDIAVNTDTITKLLAQVPTKLPVGTILLPSDKYSTVSSVDMKDCEEIAAFNVSIDLDFLVNNFSGKNYALGIRISSTARKVNKNYATTVVVIGTDMMKPTASFTNAVSGTDVKTVNFSSTSLMTVGYSWNFGDGSVVATTKAPSHTYATAGTYTVTLTALGVTGSENQSVSSKVITVL